MRTGKIGGWLAAAVVLTGAGFVAGWMVRRDWQAAERPLVLNFPAAPAAPPPDPPVVPETKPAVPEPVPVLRTLERFFKEWSAAQELAGALVGFCVLDAKGEIVYSSPLGGTALCPASALKTVTTGAAFGMLGTDFRFETKVTAGSAISPEGRVAGDLTLVGSGDPTLEVEDLEAIAADLVKLGLKRVEGSLKVDASVFDENPVSDHWNWGDIGNAYGAGAYGVNVGHNRISLVFDPGMEVGDSALFKGSTPALTEMDFDSQVATGPAGSGDRVMIYSMPGGKVIRMRGTVPLGRKGFTVRGAVPDPPALAASILRKALAAKGVVFSQRKSTTNPEEPVLLGTHVSAPLPEIIDHLHEVSDNLEAQCLFLTMGRRQNAPPAEALQRYWESAGISFTGLRLIDGSGLARATMIRPVDLAKVNHAARHGPNGERFLASLSQDLEGRIRSKRGAMSGVRTEVGFINRDGNEYTFVLMANGLDGGTDFWRLRVPLLEAIGR